MPLTNLIRFNKEQPEASCIFGFKKIYFFAGILGVTLSLFSSPILAQQHSYDPNTDNDGGKQAYDCRADIRRFCDGLPGILLFEQENCLQSHMDELKPVCRQHMSSTDFRKYYQSEAHPLGF
jgi:hypothetical protein